MPNEPKRLQTVRNEHNRTALVLGGAGSAGYAWEIGVIAGLLNAGLDITKADLVIGTSAGSTVAVHVAGGTPPAELLAALLAMPPRPRTGPAASRGTRVSARPAGLPGDAIIAAAEDAADMRRKMGAAALEAAAASDGSVPAQRRATVAARLPNQHWPERPVQIVAVDARTGEPVVFDRHCGIDLVDAITASTASSFPHSTNGHQYIDGGYRRNENADLAVGFSRVLVLSPYSGRSRHPLEWGMQLSSQVDELRAAGSQVETIFPDGAAHDIFAGTNQMDPSNMAPAARAGFDQGKAIAGRLADFWG